MTTTPDWPIDPEQLKRDTIALLTRYREEIARPMPGASAADVLFTG